MGSPKGGDVLADLRAAIAAANETLEGAEKGLKVAPGYLSHVFARDYKPGRAIAGRIATRYGIGVERWDAPAEASE